MCPWNNIQYIIYRMILKQSKFEYTKENIQKPTAFADKWLKYKVGWSYRCKENNKSRSFFNWLSKQFLNQE